jgi:hypothetical protein
MIGACQVTEEEVLESRKREALDQEDNEEDVRQEKDRNPE